MCHRQRKTGGWHDRFLSEKNPPRSRRQADLPDVGLAVQATSPMPGRLSNRLGPNDGAALERRLPMQALTFGRCHPDGLREPHPPGWFDGAALDRTTGDAPPAFGNAQGVVGRASPAPRSNVESE